MFNTEIVIAICTVITTLLTMKFWLFKSVNIRLDAIDSRLAKIEEDISDIKKDLRTLDKRISYMEGYLMGRDFRNGTDR